MEGRDFPLVQTGPGAHSDPVKWVPGLPGVKVRLGRDADHSSPSSAVVKKEYSYASTAPVGRTACTEPQCLPVQACTLPFKSLLRTHCTGICLKEQIK